MTAVILWTTAAIVWLYFITLHKKLWMEATRQQLFAIRDNLFDQAGTSDLPFDSDGYQLMRNTLNGMIHYAHDISGSGAIVMRFMAGRSGAKDDGVRYESAYVDALKKLSPAGRKAIKDARARMHLVVASHVVHTSAVLLAGLYVVKLAKTAEQITKIAMRPRHEWRPIDATAHCIGSRNVDAHC